MLKIKNTVKQVKESNRHGVRMKLDPKKNYPQATLQALKKWFPNEIVEDKEEKKEEPKKKATPKKSEE